MGGEREHSSNIDFLTSMIGFHDWKRVRYDMIHGNNVDELDYRYNL